jgi:hypothetical protein
VNDNVRLLRRQVRALKKSLVKLKAVAYEGGLCAGRENCPLCKAFLKRIPYRNPEKPKQKYRYACTNCPTAQVAGIDKCEGSPWKEWEAYQAAHRTDNVEQSSSYRVFDQVSRDIAIKRVAFVQVVLGIYERKLAKAIRTP